MTFYKDSTENYARLYPISFKLDSLEIINEMTKSIAFGIYLT